VRPCRKLCRERCEALGEKRPAFDTARTENDPHTSAAPASRLPTEVSHLASWYDEQGPAADVLHVGELPDPTPGPGEVRVRVTVSAVNPGDTKKRRGWLGSSIAGAN
jgi:hypothetical protein